MVGNPTGDLIMTKVNRLTDPDLKLIWKHTHPDYRGVINGVRHVLCMNPTTGATESVPLDGLTLEERASRLKYATTQEERGRKGW
jgi:hypothetical protein